MNIFGSWWFKLLINAALSLVIFFVLWITLGTIDKSGTLICGLITLPAQFLFFIAFDTLGWFRSKFYEVIRYVLVVTGGIVVLVSGIVGSVLFGYYQEIGSPWIYSFFVTGLLNGVSAFLFYYLINDCVLPEILNAFVPLALIITSYILNVIFIYLGSSVHSFFYAYFGLIIGLSVTLIMITIIIIKHSIEFRGTAVRRAEAMLKEKISRLRSK